MKYKLLLLIVLLTGYSSAGAVDLTLFKCLDFARENSPKAKIAQENLKSRTSAHDAVVTAYYPQLSLSGSLPGLTRSIDRTPQPDGTEIFTSSSRMYSMANLDISQSIPWTGGRITVGSGLRRIDLLGDYERTDWNTTPFQINLRQPIFQFNSMEFELEEAALNYENIDRLYAEEIEALNMEITSKFFEVYFAKMQVENARLNVSINDTLYQISKGRYQVGKIAENDLLQNELALSDMKVSLETSELDYERSREELLNLIGMGLDTEIIIIPPDSVKSIDVTPEAAVKQAFANRSDILTFKIRELNADRRVAVAENNNNFNATITAGYGLNNSASKVDAAYKDLLDQESVNLSFQMPIFQWGRNTAEVEEAMANREISLHQLDIDRKNFEKEVRYLALRFEQLQKQVEIAYRSKDIAARRFEVARNRYLISKIDVNDLFIAQREKDSALQSYIRTLQNYWVAYFNLRRLTLFDFNDGKPLIRDRK